MQQIKQKQILAIQKKLEYLMPNIVASQSILKNWDGYLYNTYAYTKEIISVMAGAGITIPVLGRLDTPGMLVEKISTLSFGLGLICVAIVSFFKIRIERENVVSKIIGRRKLMRQFKVYNANILQALQSDDPQTVLNELSIIQKDMGLTINNGIQEDLWPDNPEYIFRLGRSRARELVSNYSSNWNVDQNVESLSQVDDIPEQII